MDLIILLAIGVAVLVARRRNRRFNPPYQNTQPSPPYQPPIRKRGCLTKILWLIVGIVILTELFGDTEDKNTNRIAQVEETTVEEIATEVTTVEETTVITTEATTEEITTEETEVTTEETTVILTLEDKIKSVYGDDYVAHTVEEGSIVVFTKGSIGWSNRSTNNFLDQDVVDLLEAIQDEDYIDLTVIANVDAIDQYGNDKEKLLYQVTIEKSEADKVDFSRFRGSMLRNIARSRYIDEQFAD